MTRDILAKWLRDCDEKLKKQKRKICLFLDNCRAQHTAGVLFESIEVCFLPPYTTAAIQPLDQGVIMAFKADYRKRLIDRVLINKSLKLKTNIRLEYGDRDASGRVDQHYREHHRELLLTHHLPATQATGDESVDYRCTS